MHSFLKRTSSKRKQRAYERGGSLGRCGYRLECEVWQRFREQWPGSALRPCSPSPPLCRFRWNAKSSPRSTPRRRASCLLCRGGRARQGDERKSATVRIRRRSCLVNKLNVLRHLQRHSPAGRSLDARGMIVTGRCQLGAAVPAIFALARLTGIGIETLYERKRQS
jgi:hypothetical protein